ncbi:MAG: hypothetical protein U0931_28930 [Vulcanimicrobiota bacterium]
MSPSLEMNFVHLKRAFSLAEVLVATFLFSTIVSALCSVWVTHARCVTQAQDSIAATNLGQMRMAEQVGLGFRARNGEGTTTLRRWTDGKQSDTEFHWVVRVDDRSETTPDLKYITVTVDWSEQGKTQKIQLVSCVYWQG